MRTLLVVTFGALLVSGQALAARKVLVMGAGDCREPTLTTAVKEFHDEARPLLKAQLFEPEVVLDAVRPRPSRSLQDIQRLVDSARTLLYGGENERGLELVKQALTELDKASPQVNPWPVTVAALLVQSQLYKNLERTKEMNEAYRRVLRIDPAFTLDPDAYPPSTLQAFEAVRKEVTRARKAMLVVQSTPAGAAVFVDGKARGRTPLKLELIPGAYRLWLMQDGRVSFPHPVELADNKRDASLQIDMGFESAVSQQPPLCVSATDDDEARKLGPLMVADEVIIVRNIATTGNPPYITAVSYDATGRQQRNGGAPPGFIGRLATFILTGQDQPGVRPGTDLPPLAAVAPPPGGNPETMDGRPGAPPPEPGPVPPGVKQPPPPPPLVGVEPSSPSAARVVSYALIAAGVGGAIAGVVVYGTGAASRDRLAALSVSDGRLYPPGTPNYEEAVALMPKVDANRTVAFTLLGAGVGAAVAGGLGALLLPGEATQLAVVPTGQGGWVSVSGRF
ncbi:MAG: PEGA domain-containing protein [Myxococcota bacterium]